MPRSGAGTCEAERIPAMMDPTGQESEPAPAGHPWTDLSPGDPGLFDRLRGLGHAEIYVHVPIGTETGYRVAVPGASLSLRGTLEVAPGVDRLIVRVPGWGVDDLAWFGRRKGRGRPDYWQFAIEHRPEGFPGLVLYGTAPLDGIVLRVRWR